MKTDKIAVAMHQQQSQVNHTSKTPRRVSDKGGSWEEHVDPGTNKIYYQYKNIQKSGNKTNGGVNEKASIDDTENIIDFLEYLKRKRNKELN